MRVAIRILGVDLFDFTLATDSPSDSPSPEPEGAELAGGTLSSYPVGFTSSPGDQRWESCADLEGDA